MSTADVGKNQVMTPYLAVSGATLLISAIILLHTAIKGLISGSLLHDAETYIGVISYFIALVMIIVMMVLIGTIHDKRMNIIIGAVVVLGIYIVLDLISRFVQGFDSLGGLAGSIIIIIIFGVLRGVAFSLTNRALSIPLPGYGMGAFVFYGWSMIVTSAISLITGYIATLTSSPGLASFALILLTIQIFLDVICLGMIGINFIRSAIYHPIVKSRVAIKPVTTPTTLETTETITTDTISDEPKKVKEYCEFCGAAFIEDSEFCSGCGAARN